jgi:hypothetical protein
MAEPRNTPWRPDDNHDVDSVASSIHQNSNQLGEDIYRPETLKTIEETIDVLSAELKDLSYDLLGTQRCLNLGL